MGYVYHILLCEKFKLRNLGASLVRQWLRICKGCQLHPWSGKIPHAMQQQPGSHSCLSPVMQLLQPGCLEPGLCSKRSRCNGKPKNCSVNSSPLWLQLEKAHMQQQWRLTTAKKQINLKKNPTNPKLRNE